jgi:predicted 3-demethylubiquinone-9 3-methyltransferase (glyoxalase superfamily)
MQKITPFLWYDNNAEEAMNFYASVFDNSKIQSLMRAGGSDAPAMGGTVQLAGQQFNTLNGGPMYKFTPATSFFVQCETEEEIDEIWKKFSDGGMVLMGLEKYPFSEKFGWIQDKFGLSWQLNLTTNMVAAQKITPFLMFVGAQHGKAEDAIHFYTSLFPDSGTKYIEKYAAGEPGQEGAVKHASFSLNGQQFMAMESNGPHNFTFNEAFSLFVSCETQPEIDKFWEKLTNDGGKESRCGWLKDKFGVSWQIVPPILGQLLSDKDPVKSQRVMQAMMKMNKINIADLQEAYNHH